VQHMSHQQTHTGQEAHSGHQGHGGHRLMMLVCCIPMVAVAVLLVVSETAGAGALVLALGCIVMMAAMMFLMPGGHGHK
jgi:1,4-dihydroxy-2-naphthoate octaprenyltransferase